ncbi:Glia maturation factor beta [Phaffia rhodozyma]|uniref:Glia maturation factor beta n=1 Tax=Phaffia rhodozyma TaxID=264483 RepID=A0A0F7SMQ7_PHARH|nr:Glia maturation factor beta [Phaffia rhodozyma]
MSGNSYAPDQNALASIAIVSNNSFNSDDPRQVRLTCSVCSASAGYFSSAGLAVHNRLVHVLKLKFLRPPDKNGHSTVQTIYRMDGVFGCPGCDLFYHMDPFLVLTHAINAHGYRYPAAPVNSEQSASASTSTLSVPQKPPAPLAPPALQINQNQPGSQSENSRPSSRIETSAPGETLIAHTNGRNSQLDLHHYRQQQYNHRQQYQQNYANNQQTQNSFSAQNTPTNTLPITHLAPATTAIIQAYYNSSNSYLAHQPNSNERTNVNPGSVGRQEPRREVMSVNPAASSALSLPLADHSAAASQFQSVTVVPESQPNRPEYGIGWKHNLYTRQPLQPMPQHTIPFARTYSNVSNTETSDTTIASSSVPRSVPPTNHSPYPSSQIQSSVRILPSVQSVGPSISGLSTVLTPGEQISPNSTQSDTNNHTDRSDPSFAPRPLSQRHTTTFNQSQMPTMPLSRQSPSLEGRGDSIKRAQTISPSLTDEQRHTIARLSDHPNHSLSSPVYPQSKRSNSTTTNAPATRNQNGEENRRPAQIGHVLPPKPTLPPLENSPKVSSGSSHPANFAPSPSGISLTLAPTAASGSVIMSTESNVNKAARESEESLLARGLYPVYLSAKPQTEMFNGTENRSNRADGQVPSVVLGKRERKDDNPATAHAVSRQRISPPQGGSSTGSQHNTAPTTQSLPSKPILDVLPHSTLPFRPLSAPLSNEDSTLNQLQVPQTKSDDQTPSISLVFLTLIHVLPVLYSDTHMPTYLFQQVPPLISLLRAYHNALNNQIQEAILAEARGEMPEGWSQKERKKLWNLKEKCKLDPRFKRPGEYEIMFKYWHQMTMMLVKPHQVSAIVDQLNAHFPQHLENSKTRPVRHVLEQMLKQVVQFVQSYKGPPGNLSSALYNARITVPASSINKHPATLTFPLWTENSWAIVHWAQRVHEGWQTMRTLFPDEPVQATSHTDLSSYTSTSAWTFFSASSRVLTEPRPTVGQTPPISMEETLRRTRKLLDGLEMSLPVDKDRAQAQNPTQQGKEGRQGVVSDNATTISIMSATVDIPAQVKEKLKKLRFSKSNSNAAISFKINKSELVVEEDESFDSFDTIEELAEELPGNNPRYVVVSYRLTHKDGRLSTPLFMINWSPTGAAPDAKTLHASALSLFQQTADVSKVVEVREGTETLTTEFLEGILLG